VIAQLTSDHTDRELAVVIYGALTQNPDAVEELRRRALPSATLVGDPTRRR
jgi:hypothetical protein